MVAIGSSSNALGAKAIALGMSAKTKAGAGQAIAIGNNAGANSQSVALGADVFAHGKSSIAIGNDDIDDPKFDDKLPQQSINTIFRELMNDSYYFSNGEFQKKYLTGDNNADNRKFSPTYAAGTGAIAIGSRTVSVGNLSTSVGALSFALSDYSTTLGMRAFVDKNATGGVAVGQESRVFAANSLAVGNFNEASSKGSMAYGYNARAVGEHTIAIGSVVAAGARFNVDKGSKWLDLYRNFNKNEDSLNEDSEFDAKADEILKNQSQANNNIEMPIDYEHETILTIGSNTVKKTQKHGEQGNGKNAIVIGGRSFALWENSLALGYSALADASNGFAIGSYSYAGNRATNAMAIGVRSYAEGVNSIALGYRARVQDEHQNQSITGNKNQEHYKGNNSLALGIESLAYLNNSVALGHQSKTDYLYNDLLHEPYTPKGSITIPTSGQSGVISVGYKGHERRVVNVASGYLDTDAANVGQLKSLEERVNLLTSGGAGFNTPYLAVDQTSQNSEAKRITDGQKAVQNYERYVELAKQYATLLNRKANGKETFNEQSLNLIKKEVEKLGSTNNIKQTANEITKIIGELDKLQSGVNSRKSDADLKKQLDEWQGKIAKAVETDNTDEKKRQLTDLTEEEIKASNFNSNRAEGQDSIAFGFKAHTTSEAKHAIAIGYNATAKAEGAVAIGYSAVVEENAGDSVALGKNSKAEAKKTALSSADIPSGNGNNNIKFSWSDAGTSTNGEETSKKSVVSVGTQNNERVITHVAAGNVTATSTDAINGGQLYGVASVFSNMATGILGLEKANNGKDGFKDVSFTKLKDKTGQDGQSLTTFKSAIEKSIETINQGLKFAGNKDSEFTSQLGATVTIKGDGTDLISTANGTSGEISFKLEKETDIERNGSSNKVPTTQAVKTYLDNKIQGISSTLQLEADNSKGSTYGKVALKSEKLNIKGKENEIVTSVESNQQTVTIGLAEKVKNDIKTVTDTANQNKTKISEVDAKADQNATAIQQAKNSITENTNKITEVSAKADKNEKDIKDQTIAYKTNSDQDKKTVKLSEGLNFNGDTNIAVNAEANGKITHSLNTALKGINSITNATDNNGNGVKITLENAKITVNDKKITGLADGSIQDKSKDAVTGGQLYTKLAEKADKTLGNIDQNGKDVISKQAVEAIKAKAKEKTSSALSVTANASEDGKSKTIEIGLDESQLITNLSTGANITTPNNGAPKLVTDKQVSEFIGGKTLTFKDNQNGSHASKLNSEFKLVGNDDITVTVKADDKNNGNGQATFVLNKADTISDQPNTKDKVATAGAVKTYVDDALKTAKTEADKTAVKYDDETRDVITLGGKGTSHKPVVIDNLRSGLGIDDINDGGIASIKQGKTRDLVKDLVAGKLDEKAHKAANVSDLKALATAGLNFAGNDAKDIHKNLGETLAIVGQGVTDIALFKGTNNNIAVKTVAGNLEVSLNEALTAIKSLVTQAKSVDDKSGLSAISTLNGAGLHLTPAESLTNGQGKQADYGLLGSTVKDGEKTNTQTAGSITLALGEKSNTQTAESNTLQAKDAEDPTTTLTNKQTAAGNTLSDDKGNRATYDRHGVSLQDKDSNTAKLDAQGLTVGDKNSDADKTHSVYGKEGLTIHGKDGKSAVSLTTKNTNGKDAATLAFAKGEDGQAGTGAITGLKDLEANADGSSAANKNYVDNQLSSALEEVAGNRPFDYYLNDIKVSKDKDGNFYKEESGKKVKLTGAEKAQVVIKAEPQSTPITVSNIKAAKLATDSTDAVNGAQLVAATGALAGQDGKMTFADGRDGKAATDPTAAANQGLTAKDGLNGHNANDKANALRNGEAGSVVYTDSAGQRLVKANDGKYYHAADVENNGVPKDGKSAVENPQLSLVNAQGNTDKAALLGNVASGLGVKTPTAEENAQLNALAKVVDEKTIDVAKKAKTLSAQARAFSDLTLAVTSLEQVIDEMPEGDDKAQALITLKENKAELARVESSLKTARNELTTAKAQLSDANKAYDNRYNALTGATDKIADLVNADSHATLTHAATVADLQAVARAGLNVVGNDGLTVHKHLGETLSITGEGEFNSNTSAAGNINVELAQDGQGLSVKLSDKLQGMTSVETREIHGKKSAFDSNGLKTVSADSEIRVTAQGTEIVGKGTNAGKAAGYRLDGVRLQDGAGNHATLSAQQGLRLTGQAGEPSLIATKNGLVVKGAQGDIALDGQRGEILLPDVKPDASGYVAVNKNYVDSQNNELRTQLSNTNREMRAGIAGALATASLPSSAIPGKSMLAASAGTFKGHSAIALGYSKMSDNGKISIRLQGTSNSAGDLGGAVGVGYLW